MNKKALFSTLGVMLAAVIASVALVFTVGPMVSADNGETVKIGILQGDDMFCIYDKQCTGISNDAYDYVYQRDWEDNYLYDYFNVIIPEGVEMVGYYSDEHTPRFMGGWEEQNKLVSVSFPSTLKVIASYAFTYCENLTSVVIPEGVIRIDNDAFSGCPNLNNVKLPSTLKTIGESAFNGGCFDTVIIPAGVEDIGNYAFNDNVTVYCEAPSKPDGWLSYWHNGREDNVVWGYNAGNSQSGNENQNQENQPDNQNENTNAETPTENTTVTSQTNNDQANTAVVAAVAGTAGGAAGLGTMGTIFGIVVSRKRKKL